MLQKSLLHAIVGPLLILSQILSCQGSFRAKSTVYQKHPLEDEGRQATVDLFETSSKNQDSEMELQKALRDLREPPNRHRTKVSGGLSKFDLETTVNRHSRDFSNCYQNYLKRKNEKPEEGEVWLNLSVAENGTPTNVRIRYSDIRDPHFQHCIEHAFSLVKFPARDPESQILDYPMEFFLIREKR